MSGLVAAATPAVLPTSSSRRKPQFIYRSPAPADGEYNKFPIIYPTAKTVSSPSSSTSPVPTPSQSSAIQLSPRPYTQTPAPTRKKYDMGPPLPLYHPFGKLSMSLPALDITYTSRLGLPPMITPEEAPPRKSVGRGRTKHGSSNDESDLAIMAEVAAAAAAAETKSREKEKAAGIPRKKPVGAGGGRGGGPGKRKRKDHDDGDPTYPAKRPRLPRGVAAKESSSGDSPPESSERVSATPEEFLPVEEKKPSNRGGRRKRGGGRGGRRRNSSASERTDPSAVPGPLSTDPDGEVDTSKMDALAAATEEAQKARSPRDTQTDDTRQLSEPL